MKKNLGPALALYPMPIAVIGAHVQNKPNWTLVAHVGIVSHDSVLVSLAKPHYINQGILENKRLSINLVDQSLLEKADYVGSVSGHKIDKSQVFDYSMSDQGVPIINDSPLVIEGSVVDVYEYQNFDNFIVKIENTYVDEDKLNDQGKIDYQKVNPILFDFPNYEYLSLGQVVGKCLKLHDKKND